MPRTISPEIVYEDSDIIVCRKPAGIPTQSAHIGTPDMVSILKTYLVSIPGEKSQDGQSSMPVPAGKHASSSARREPYLAVIHRLDQPVEGLLVFAKNPAAAKNLNRQLTSSGFGKYYRAVIRGVPEPSEGTLEDYLVKDGRSNTSRVCTKDTPGAKLSRLHYKVIGTSGETEPVTSRVEIRLDTGRHHQIRVQMAHLGYPLVGDRKYGEAFCKNKNPGKSRTELLRLCAFRLEFKHPGDGRKMIFELPEDTGSCIERSDISPQRSGCRIS